MSSETDSSSDSDNEQENGSEDIASGGDAGGPPPQHQTGLTGNKAAKKHTRRFIERVVASATGTHESEELGRLLALLVLEADYSSRRCKDLIATACVGHFDVALISAFNDAGGPDLSTVELVELVDRCAGGGPDRALKAMKSMAELMENGFLNTADAEDLTLITQLGEEEWAWPDRIQYAAQLCEACTTKEGAVTIMKGFCTPRTLDEKVELVQSIVDCAFFYDLTGEMGAVWRAMPELTNLIDVPTGGGGAEGESEDNSDMDGFIDDGPDGQDDSMQQAEGSSDGNSSDDSDINNPGNFRHPSQLVDVDEDDEEEEQDQDPEQQHGDGDGDSDSSSSGSEGGGSGVKRRRNGRRVATEDSSADGSGSGSEDDAVEDD